MRACLRLAEVLAMHTKGENEYGSVCGECNTSVEAFMAEEWLPQSSYVSNSNLNSNEVI